MKDDAAIIDSNILVYAYDETEKNKHLAAKALIYDIIKKDKHFVLSVQNISEFFFIITEKLKMDKEVAEYLVKNYAKLESGKILGINPNSVIRAMDISREYNIHYWDALIAAVMEENGIKRIYTENVKDFSKVPWIEVINPLIQNS